MLLTDERATRIEREHQPIGRWLQVVTHMDPRFGGLSSAVPNLATALVHATGEEGGIAAFCSPGELYMPPANPQVSLREWPASRKAWMTHPELGREFASRVQAMDGVHIHGLWEHSTVAAAAAARRARKPYVLSAHGMLEPWALQNKRLKKALYAALIERRNVNGAGCLHALTRAEAEHYRCFGAGAPIAVIPNGVHIPQRVTATTFLAQNPSLHGKRVVLFLGRLHFKKGIDLLIRAWASVSQRHPDAALVLAGPDFDGTKARMVSLAEELGLANSVFFPGMLRDELKWSALALAEAFVLPSYSEGLAISILEAMGVGLPVIISEACHMPEVAEMGAGWVIPARVGELVDTLRQLLTRTPLQNRSMGAQGSSFVRSRYSWSRVAGQVAEVYAWLQGGPRPATVEILDAGAGRRARA